MNKYENLILNIAIISGIIIIISALFLFFLSFLKLKNSKKLGLYIYALTSSMLIILGAYGFYKEGFEGLQNEYDDKYSNLIIPVVSVSATFFGVFFSILLRYLIIKKNSNIHVNHHDHGHSDYIFNLRDIDNAKNKWSAILLILNHRVVESISIGVLLVQEKYIPGSGFQFPLDKVGFLTVFIVHIILESVFIYYRQIEMGISKKKVFLNSIIMKIIIIPFMIIGAFVFQAINHSDYTNWILPFMFIFSGSIMVFVSIIELVPEFIDNKNMNSKQWFSILICFAFGMAFTILMSSFHIHDHSHEHGTEAIYKLK